MPFPQLILSEDPPSWGQDDPTRLSQNEDEDEEDAGSSMLGFAAISGTKIMPGPSQMGITGPVKFAYEATVPVVFHSVKNDLGSFRSDRKYENETPPSAMATSVGHQAGYSPSFVIFAGHTAEIRVSNPCFVVVV